MNFLNKLQDGVYNGSQYLVGIANDDQNKINRVVRSALPYFTYYGPFNEIAAPFGQLMLVVGNGKKGILDLTDVWRNKEISKPNLAIGFQAGRGLVEVAVAITCVVHYPIGIMSNIALNMANQVHFMGTRIYRGECTSMEVGKFAIKFSAQALRLGSMICAAPEVLVASVAIQILLEVGHSYREYKKGHYIETISGLGLAVIRGYQTIPQAKAISQKWTQKTIPSSEIKEHDDSKIMPPKENGLERRGVVDTGSGGTKVLIVDVDVKTNKIMGVVYEHSFSVGYQAALEKSSEGAFDTSIKEQGLKTFHQIKEIFDQHGVEKVSAIATEAFRKSANGYEFAAAVESLTQIPLRVVSQNDEGIFAYNSALAASSADPTKAVVWDIGTGSFQITARSDENDFIVFTGGAGSVPFKNQLIELEGKDAANVSTPNPVSNEAYKAIGLKVRRLARGASRDLKSKIKSKEVNIIGIGRLFANSVLPLVSDGTGNEITRKGLRNFIKSSLNKADDELNNPFASSDVPNCIQVLEVMKALHIHKIVVVNATTTKGLAVASPEDFKDWT